MFLIQIGIAAQSRHTRCLQLVTKHHDNNTQVHVDALLRMNGGKHMHGPTIMSCVTLSHFDMPNLNKCAYSICTRISSSFMLVNFVSELSSRAAFLQAENFHLIRFNGQGFWSDRISCDDSQIISKSYRYQHISDPVSSCAHIFHVQFNEMLIIHIE